MATDRHDKDTGDLLKRKPGRPPVYGRRMTPAERKAAERARRRARGERQMWLSKDEYQMIRELRDSQSPSVVRDRHSAEIQIAVQDSEDRLPVRLLQSEYDEYLSVCRQDGLFPIADLVQYIYRRIGREYEVCDGSDDR